jgi:triacylglycerol lipase
MFAKTIRRILNCLFLLLFFNVVLLFASLDFNLALKVCATLALFAFYIGFNIKPYSHRKYPGQGIKLSQWRKALPLLRARILMDGRECVLSAMACFLLEIVFYSLVIYLKLCPDLKILIANAAACLIFMGILAINGSIRILATSKQAGIATKLLFIFFWWVPILNIILLKKLCASSVKEYVFITQKAGLNEDRKDKEVCKTKYPILLVHGVFWRDWKYRFIWGRIPDELSANGAVIFYGNNKSSSSVEESGAELAERIKSIAAETGCEKLNIIAHSKGGLDCRYAISRMGAGKNAASLTTICTPHYGCPSIRKLVERIPQKTMHYVNKKYETLFTIFGDENPDFLNGLAGITDTVCAELNEIMPDDPSVYYQSVGAKMKSSKSAIFPLSLGYSIIKPEEGENDGLVAVNSMAWGNYLGTVTPVGKQGISHGDMVDLTRKNIEGFDVCEFYVDLVSKLREQGL